MKANETKDLLISAVVLAFAFGIALSGGFKAFLDPVTLIVVSIICLFVISLGFVLHELGHRFIARKFGCHARYQMWQQGLLIALVFSLFEFIFAAPGAVMIYQTSSRRPLTKKKIGLISLSGPLINILLAVFFMLLNLALPSWIFYLGVRINTLLALFNLIPFQPFDGAKIFAWSRKIWLGVIIVAIGLFIL